MFRIKHILTVALIVSLLGTILSCTTDLKQTGTLEGNVTIGPIWPVERAGENPPVPPEVFEARRIMVYDKDGNKLIQKVDIEQIDQSQEGHYRVQFKPADM